MVEYNKTVVMLVADDNPSHFQLRDKIDGGTCQWDVGESRHHKYAHHIKEHDCLDECQSSEYGIGSFVIG